jgi:hypothetical protein
MRFVEASMLGFIRAAGARFKEFGSLLWRAAYSVGLTVLCALGLVLIPQGAEALRLVSQPGWNFPLFLVAVTSWSLSAWYSSRLTLGRVFHGSSTVDRANTPFVRFMRKWLPRFLGVLPPTLLGLMFYQLGEYRLAAACAAVAMLLGVFMLKRRDWFARRFRPGKGSERAALRFHSLQRETVLTVACAIVLSFLLLGAVWWKPVEVTDVVTAPALLCFALASWILFGDLVLTYACKQANLPSMAALPVLLFVVFSPWNDNHGVNLIAGNQGPPIRRVAATHLERWLAARQASGELERGRQYPLFLVASEGGGIRAAYWAGSVLAKLQDDSGERFGSHVFALSGVSGGSLANAMFAALMAERQAGTLAQAPCALANPAVPFQSCARQVLRRDFLSPALGYMLYPDMLQRFLPLPMPSADRARAMEKAWQAGWTRAAGSDRFNQRFDHLWQGPDDVGIPSLLLNATLVEGGNRIIASDLVVDGQFPDAWDAFDPLLDTRQMSLATAVHNSARFMYISPAGTLSACRAGQVLVPCADKLPRTPWGRVIDGAYFENSGVETIRDLLVAMRPTLDRWQNAGYDIAPLVLMISNSPGVRAPAGRRDPRSARLDMTFLSELLAPPLGLFNTRIARATFAVSAESRDMAGAMASDPVRFFWFGMMTKNDIPLGWALADRSYNDMDQLLQAPAVAALPFGSVLQRIEVRGLRSARTQTGSE